MKLNLTGIDRLLKLYPQLMYAPDDGAGAGGAGGDAGDDAGGAGSEVEGTAGAAGAGSSAVDDKGKLISQDIFNKEVSKIRSAARKEVESYLGKFKEIQERLNLSETEKERIALDLEEIRTQNLTEVQKRDLELKKWETRYNADTERLTQAAKTWQERFEQQQFHVAVQAAVGEHKGFDPDQFTAILSRMGVKIKEVTVDDKATGAYDARVVFPDIDVKDNKPVMLDLSVSEAVKRMSELAKYRNLFTPNMSEGSGLRNADAGDNERPVDWKKMTPVEYEKRRPKLVGSK